MRFIADEDFNNRILRGMLRRQPDLDVVRIQDTRLSGGTDQEILEWAFQEQRILLTHDVSTMTKYAFERTHAGKSFAGVIEVPQTLAVGIAIDDILTIVASSSTEEFVDQILFLPL
ncbi:MAG: DUF5615 family PIN-like protein [Anaerolineales bacterium]